MTDETSTIGCTAWKRLADAARALGINAKLNRRCRAQGTFACSNHRIIEIAKSVGVEIYVHPRYVTGTGYVHALTGIAGWHKPIRVAQHLR